MWPAWLESCKPPVNRLDISPMCELNPFATARERERVSRSSRPRCWQSIRNGTLPLQAPAAGGQQTNVPYTDQQEEPERSRMRPQQKSGQTITLLPSVFSDCHEVAGVAVWGWRWDFHPGQAASLSHGHHRESPHSRHEGCQVICRTLQKKCRSIHRKTLRFRYWTHNLLIPQKSLLFSPKVWQASDL